MKAGDEKAEERILLQKARDLYAKALTEADANRKTAAEQKAVNEHARKAADALAQDGDADYDPLWEEESLVGKSMLDGGAQFSISGVREDGIEVYETSKTVMNLTWNERISRYLDIMKNEYKGRVARFERNGHIYYALFDVKSLRKPIFGDDRSTRNGKKAIIKIGADGDVFDLVENARYTGSKKNTKDHTDADYFDYFVKTVQIDGKVFDLVADVEKKYGGDGDYVYTLALKENKKIEAFPTAEHPKRSLFMGAGNASDNSISETGKDVKGKLSISRTAEENEKILSRMRSILQNGGSAADLKQFVSDLEKKEGVDKTKTPSVRTDRRTDAAADIVRKAHAAEMSVEEYLRENAELYETEDGWNSDARRALRMESGARYSISSVKIPTREELESKPDMKVVDISSPKTRGTFAERRKEILQQAETVIKRPYQNRDTNAMIFLTKGSYTHAFNNIGEIQLNAAEHLPEFIENAVLTHAEKPTHGSDYAEGVYTLFAAANDGKSVRPVKLKVKEYAYAGQDLPKNIKEYFENSPQGYAASYDTVVLEVEEIAENPSGSVKDMNQIDSFLDPEELSEISIADLLSLVKGDAEKYIPKPAVKSKLSVSAERDLYGPWDTNAEEEADFSGKQEISDSVRDKLIKRTKEENERIRVEERKRKKEAESAKETADKKYRELWDALPDEAKNKFREINRAKLDCDWDLVTELEDAVYESEYADMYSEITDADFERRWARERTEDFKKRGEQAYFNTAGEIEARDVSDRQKMTAEERREKMPNRGGKDVVFAEREGWISSEYDPETASVKDQLKNAMEDLNRMEIVASAKVPTNFTSKQSAAKWAIELLKKYGYKVDRQNFGVIYFNEKDINYAVNYADTDAEKSAIAVLPSVLKRGIEIGSHGNHKNREKATVTIAAAVELNGIRGNMAVVVNRNGNHYYAHRILLPDGSTFVFNNKTKKDAAQEPHRGVVVSDSLADATSATSENSVAQSKPAVKRKLSVSAPEETFKKSHTKADSALKRTEKEKIKIHPHSGWYFIFGQSPTLYWLRTSAL